MWAALLHDVGKPATFTQDAQGRGHFYGHPEVSATMARSIMKRLAISSDIAQPACLLIRWHDHPMRDTRADLLHGMHRFAGEALGAAIPFALALASRLAGPEASEQVKKGIVYRF